MTEQSQPTDRPTVLTILLMVLSCFCVVGGDTAGKLLFGQGISQFFVGWSRFAFGALILVPFCGLMRHELRQLLDGWVILRGALISCGILFILTALKTEPIANAFGAFFIGPVISYGLSVAFLGERVTTLRTLLLLAGFGGVLLVVRPGGDSGLGLIYALMAGVFYGAYLSLTRALTVRYRPRFLLAAQLLTGTVLLAPIGLPFWPETSGLGIVPAGIWALVVISALASATGNFLILTVNKTVAASTTAPLIYFQLVAAAILGWLVFGDWPDPVSLAGLLVILGSGLAGFALVIRR